MGGSSLKNPIFLERGEHEFFLFLGGGRSGGGTGESPKKGAWIVYRFKRGLGKRRGYFFKVGGGEGGGLRPQGTL